MLTLAVAQALKQAIRTVAADTDLWADVAREAGSTPVEYGRSRPGPHPIGDRLSDAVPARHHDHRLSRAEGMLSRAEGIKSCIFRG